MDQTRNLFRYAVRLLCLAAICMFIFSSTANAESKEEVRIYVIKESSYEPYLSIPDSYNTMYQFAEGSSAQYEILAGESVSISSDGTVTPEGETWYYYGGFGTTSPPDPNSGQQPTSIVKDLYLGTTKVKVITGDTSYLIDITVCDYTDIYVEDVIDRYLAEHITPDMTDMEKLDAIAAFPAQYPYSTEASGYQGMIIKKGGDCWASTSAIVELCGRVGIEAYSRYAAIEPGAGSGHYNAVAFVDGKTYVVEAGYSSTNTPRYYSVTEEPGGYYVRNNKLLQYDGKEGSLVIPEEIDGKTIESIGSLAFYRNKYVKLTDITLPQTLTTLEDQALESLHYIQEFYIPASVSSIGDLVFTDCQRLERIVVDPENPYYSDDDGVLYNKDNTKLLYYPTAGKTSYRIPDSVTDIEEYAFYYTTGIKALTVPASVTSIGVWAFANSGLKTVIFEGDKPENFEEVFHTGIDSAKVYYPAGNTTWDSAITDEAYADITWIAKEGSESLSECEMCGHLYEYGTEVVNNQIEGICSRCGHKINQNVPYGFSLFWRNSVYGGSDSYWIPDVNPAGSILYVTPGYLQGDEGCGDFCDLVVECSDESVLKMPEELQWHGKNAILVLKPGVAHVKFYLKYNPGVCYEYDLIAGDWGALDIAECEIQPVHEDGIPCEDIDDYYPFVSLFYNGACLYEGSHYTVEYTEDDDVPVLYINGTGVFDGTMVYRYPIVHDMSHVEGCKVTCEQGGSNEYWFCDSCGKYFADANGQQTIEKDSWNLPASGHQEEIIPGTPATCTEEGLTEGARCSVCGKELVAQKPIPAMGHDWDEGVITEEATADTSGVITYTCRNDSSHTRTAKIHATSHVLAYPVRENEKEATCEEEGGYEEVRYCETCGEEVSREYVTVPALGHQWSKTPVTDVPASCSQEGVRSVHCANCGARKDIVKIPKTAHSWDRGVITKPATVEAAGVRTYTCTKCGHTKTEAIAKLPVKRADQPADPATAPTAVKAEQEILNQKGDEAPAGSSFCLLQLRFSKVKKTSIKLKWTRVNGATGYIIYGNRCGKSYKKLKTINSGSTTTWTQKKLKKGKYYKYYIIAVQKHLGEDKVIASSKTIHAATSGGKVGNYKSVKLKNVKKNKIALSIGKSFKIKAKEVAASKKLKVKRHRKLAYESTNPLVAAVDGKGKVIAKSKGICNVYVYTQSGTFKKITITVN